VSALTEEGPLGTIEHWIDGRATGGTGVRFSPVLDPATGQQSAQVVLASRADADAAAGYAFPTAN
jgi:malonate-semialdehyde dehydrogenase (acetylating)/methylmalonate-semialdehyde dehydrogenase